jgi:hypothetical protein
VPVTIIRLIGLRYDVPGREHSAASANLRRRRGLGRLVAPSAFWPETSAGPPVLRPRANRGGVDALFVPSIPVPAVVTKKGAQPSEPVRDRAAALEADEFRVASTPVAAVVTKKGAQPSEPARDRAAALEADVFRVAPRECQQGPLFSVLLPQLRARRSAAVADPSLLTLAR